MYMGENLFAEYRTDYRWDCIQMQKSNELTLLEIFDSKDGVVKGGFSCLVRRNLKMLVGIQECLVQRSSSVTWSLILRFARVLR